MSKATIERRAKSAPGKCRVAAASQELASTAERIASDAREGVQPRAEREAVNLSRETIGELADAVAAAIATRLGVMLPVCARIAAADTLHNVQQPATIFKHAVNEGIIAAEVIRGLQP